MSRKKLFIGDIDTLFVSSDSEDEIFQDAYDSVKCEVEKKIKIASTEDGNTSDDDVLMRAYDSCIDQIECEKNNKSELDDGFDNILNESYEIVKNCVENDNTEKNAEKSELDDGFDNILNESYEIVKSCVENDKTENNAENRVEARSMIPENMMHLVRNSKKQIERNRLLAKIRLIENKIKWSAKFKAEMSDYFFSIESWPNYAIETLLSRYFGYAERIKLACFLHGNGLRDIDKALKIFQFYNRSYCWDRHWCKRFQKFQSLFAYLDEAYKSSDVGDRIRNEYFYYDMNLNMTMFYDGCVRTNSREKRRYFPLFQFKK